MRELSCIIYQKKNKKMKTIILSILFLVPSVIFAQFDRNKMPEAKDAPKINIKDSEVFTTKNGITVILSENHKLPKVTFNYITGASPKMEDEMAGLSEIAGSLVMSGTENRTKDELDAQVDYIGASLNADNNSVRLSCLTKHMQKGLDLMSDVALHANFPQSEVDRIIKQYESSLISAQSDGGTMAANAAAVSNFSSHPYGEVMTEATLAAINRDAIVNYYKQNFIAQGSYLVVVGDITRTETEKAVEAHFSSWNAGSLSNQTLDNKKTISGNQVIFVKKPGAVQSVIKITFPMNIKPNNPDYLKLKVLNAVLGGGVFSNRLMQNLREDKAYTYGCRSYMNIDNYGSTFEAGGNFRNAVTDSAITEILYELEQISTKLVKDEELAITKSSMAGGFARSLESSNTVARFALSVIKNKLPKDYYQTYLQQLESITKEDLLAVGKKYITYENCNIVVVGNEEVLEKLTKFDADGKITKLDAFGQEVKEMKEADITADELISKYIRAVTMLENDKKIAKKMKKLKSVVATFDLTSDQIPIPMTSVSAFEAPNSKGQMLSGQGMVFQKSYFDGATGQTSNMQTGVKELTEEEISAKSKSVGYFPEMNYSTSGMEYTLKGIEEKKGLEYYVLETNDGSSVTMTYFDTKSFLLMIEVSTVSQDGETQTTTVTYGDYKNHGGFMLPGTMVMNAGPMTFNGTVKTYELNGDINWDEYK